MNRAHADHLRQNRHAFSSLAGLQVAADAARLAFVGPVEIDDPEPSRFAFDSRWAAGAIAVAVMGVSVYWLMF